MHPSVKLREERLQKRHQIEREIFESITPTVKSLLGERFLARNANSYIIADLIRDGLYRLGIELQDLPTKTIYKICNGFHWEKLTDKEQN